MIRDDLVTIRGDIRDSADLLPSALAEPLWLVSDDIAAVLRSLEACQWAWKEIEGEKAWFRLVPDSGHVDADT